MSRTRTVGRPRPQQQTENGRPPETFLDFVRYFLPAHVWRQAQQTPGAPSKKIRWSLQPLVLVLLGITWCAGDSQAERFETARAFCVCCQQKRKRPGTTLQGFEQALSRLPLPVLRALAAGIRRQIVRHLSPLLTTYGFTILGCDGARLETPRSAELEQRLPQAGKTEAAPTVYTTALVHVVTGMLWAWQIGLGTASEHFHLQRLLRTAPRNTLLVADAAFVGYDLFRAILGRELCFLFRASSRAYLYTAQHVRLKRFREGIVDYWPGWAQKKKLPPLRLRLLCIRGKKVNVWLLTNVLDAARLSHAAAGQIYRWRWQNEGFFRTYKRTLCKFKLRSRSVKLLHREVEGSLLAVQLLLAHGALALQQPPRQPVARSSPRQVLRALRQEMNYQIALHLGQRQHQTYRQRLGNARLQERQRRSRKARRDWPRRKPHRSPAAPILRVMPGTLKTLKKQLEQAA
jgi:DDE family transposase